MDTIPNLPALYLEDFRVGQRFVTHTHTIDERQIIDFARLYDPQPFHLDPVAARDSFFHGLVASGWHTAAISMRLIVDTVPIAGGLIGAGGESRWPLPTRPGDVLHVEGEVIDIKPSRSRLDRGLITVRMNTLNHNNECVQELTAKMLVFRRPK